MQTSIQSEKSDIEALIKMQPRLGQITFFKCEPTIADPIQNFCSYQEHKFFTLEAAEGFRLVEIGDYPVSNLYVKRFICVEDCAKTNRQPPRFLIIDSRNIVNGGTKTIIEKVLECSFDDIPDEVWKQVENNKKWHVRLANFAREFWGFIKEEPLSVLLPFLLLLSSILLLQ